MTARASLYSGMPTPLSLDTSPDAERMQVGAWGRMSAAEKAALITGLTRAVHRLAVAGVRQRYPHASPREQFLRLDIVLHGRELARAAYPEIDVLDAR
jgi:hypothetical protein